MSDDPLAWSRDYTPVLRSLAEEYDDEQPLDGYTVAVASHLETKTGVFIETLHAAGARVLVTGNEPYSTRGPVVEALSQVEGIETYVEAARDLVAGDRDLAPGLYQVPDRLDRAVARRKLDAMGVEVDEMIERQREYYEDWRLEGSAF